MAGRTNKGSRSARRGRYEQTRGRGNGRSGYRDAAGSERYERSYGRSGAGREDRYASQRGARSAAGFEDDAMPLNHEQERIQRWLKQVRFKTALIGGVEESDVWKKIAELNTLYEAALSAERARYDALLAAQRGSSPSSALGEYRGYRFGADPADGEPMDESLPDRNLTDVDLPDEELPDRSLTGRGWMDGEDAGESDDFGDFWDGDNDE